MTKIFRVKARLHMAKIMTQKQGWANCGPQARPGPWVSNPAHKTLQQSFIFDSKDRF